MRGRLTVLGFATIALFALSELPNVTGEPVHEWIGLACFIALAVHGVARLRVVPRSVRRGHAASATRTGIPSSPHSGVGALCKGMLACATICAVSGLMMSGAVLPAFGLYVPDGYFVWESVHAATAKVLLVLVIFHIADMACARFDRKRRKNSSERLDQGRTAGKEQP
ncbi:MAG: cytochrome b/b6 domain-containing protein [Eggerthellaceae bacterium]|jgi:cytochrome b|nr:cytochrome b/b6 domain-containing protein [Eggerthellaceae bacterium]